MARISICLLLFLSLEIFAQSPYSFNRVYDVPVSANGNTKAFPWLGGINSAQFSNIDFNQDGIQDLFMFDKTDNSISTFIIDVNNELQHAPEYQSAFPELIEWVLLRDFDNDGVLDIFSATLSDHIRLHKGSITNGNWSFSLITDALLDQSTGEAIFVASTDIPAIDDMNGDGTMDILTFDGAGTFVVLYENTSGDNPSFSMSDECWGNFYEQGNSPELVLNKCTVGLDAPEDITVETRSGVHPGSTLATSDLNGNGLKDLLLGDIAFSKITQVSNGGTLADAHVSAQDPNFPSNSVSIDLDIFPGVYFVDTNGDGENEMLCTPNNPISSESYFCVWKYVFSNTMLEGGFTLTQKNFMVDETIDQSRMAYPTFVDYNFDGLQDLVIGNYGSKWFGNEQSISSLSLYKNVGTTNSPAFEFVTNDYLGLSTIIGGTDLTPTFGDLLGTDDLILGTSTPGDPNGSIILFPNTTPAGASEMTFGPAQFFFRNIDVGQNSTPQIVDVDRDGRDDLVIGQRNGLVHYYRQEINAAGEVVFTEIDDDLNGWGDLSVSEASLGVTNGYSSPFLCDLDSDGAWELIVGSEVDGNIHLYNDVEANLTGGAFNLVTKHILGEGYRTGKRMAITLSDKLIAGKWVMLVGNRKGGLQFLVLDDGVGIDNAPMNLVTFPNPTTGMVKVNAPRDFQSVQVWSLSGQLMKTIEEPNNKAIDLSNLPDGIYILDWHGAERYVSKVTLLK